MKVLFTRLGCGLALMGLLSAVTFTARAQGVGINNTAPDASAALDIVSSSQGVLLPRLTQAQRLAMGTGSVPAPAAGLLLFQTDGSQPGFWYNAGTTTTPAWTFLNPAGDNLGNHTATQNVVLGANQLVRTAGSPLGLGLSTLGGLDIGQNTTGNNVYLGYQAGAATTSGVYNQFVGYQAGGSNTTGSSNYAFGYGAGPATGALTNAGAIGTNAKVSLSNSLVLGAGANVGIGTSAPSATLHIGGTASTVRLEGLTGSGTRLLQADAAGNLTTVATTYPASATLTPTLSSTTTGLSNPLVAVSGNLAVVLNRGTGTLSLFDVSSPTALVLRGTYSGLSNAVKVAISGTTAAVLCNTTSPSNSNIIGNTQLFTLGSGAPVLVATLTPPAALSAVNGGIAMAGTKLYAVYDQAGGYGYFYIYDVSTPASAALLGTSNAGYYTPQAVAVAGSLAAVGNIYGGVSIISVSNPAAPSPVGSTGNPGYTAHDQPVAMTITTLSTLTIGSAQLSTYNLSSAGVPTLRNTFTTGANPVSVALSGNLAFVACQGTNTLQIIDVSGTTAILRGTSALDATPNAVAVTSTLALVANGSAANDLQAFSTASFQRNLTVAADGSVSTVAAPSGTDFIQNQTAAAQTGSFSITGPALVGGSVGIGTTTPSAALEVVGYAKFTGPVALAGATVPTLAVASFTATLPAAANTDVAVAIGGLAVARISAVTIFATATNGNVFPPNFGATVAGSASTLGGCEYSYYLNGTTLHLTTGSNAGNIYGGAVNILVTYHP